MDQSTDVKFALNHDVTPKWDWRLGLLAWIDVETTGLLDSRKPLPALLEAALVLTTRDLEVVDSCEVVIDWTQEELEAKNEDGTPRFQLDKYAMDMHAESGLMDEVLYRTTRKGVHRVDSYQDGEEVLCDFLKEAISGYDAAPVVWSGFSPNSLDRPLLQTLMPSFYSSFHHRTLDLSAVRLAVKNWCRFDDPYGLVHPGHRAMADCKSAIAVAKEYMGFFKECQPIAQRWCGPPAA